LYTEKCFDHAEALLLQNQLLEADDPAAKVKILEAWAARLSILRTVRVLQRM
jgi:hypothetical protein